MTSKPKNWQSSGGRWGPGKVHILVKVPGGSYLLCNGIGKVNFHGPGKETDNQVTCKRCLNK